MSVPATQKKKKKKADKAMNPGDATISQVRYHQSTLPSTVCAKLRWMPKMWLHHHIDFAS